MRPPLIEAVRVENYRALRELELKRLSPFTVLLGPNGSGKSTFFDVFAFLSDCLAHGVRDACDRRSGYREICSRGSTGPIAVQISCRERPRARLVTYRLEAGEEQGLPVISREVLRWNSSVGAGRPAHVLDFRLGAGCVIDSAGETARRVTSLPSPAKQRRGHPRDGARGP